MLVTVTTLIQGWSGKSKGIGSVYVAAAIAEKLTLPDGSDDLKTLNPLKSVRRIAA